MKVKAISMGYVGVKRQRIGAEFDMKPYEFFDCDHKGKPRQNPDGSYKVASWVVPLDQEEAGQELQKLLKFGAKRPIRKGMQRHAVVPVGKARDEVNPSVGTFRITEEPKKEKEPERMTPDEAAAHIGKVTPEGAGKLVQTDEAVPI